MIFMNFLHFCCYVSSFISDIVDLDTASGPLINFAGGFSILLIFSKNELLIFLTLRVVLFVSLVEFASEFEYFLLSIPLAVSLLLLVLEL